MAAVACVRWKQSTTNNEPAMDDENEGDSQAAMKEIGEKERKIRGRKKERKKREKKKKKERKTNRKGK